MTPSAMLAFISMLSSTFLKLETTEVARNGFYVLIKNTTTEAATGGVL